MPTFKIDPQDITNNIILVRDEQARHMALSLRMKKGELVYMTDGIGKKWTGKISQLGSKQVEITIDSCFEVSNPQPIKILAVSLLPNDRWRILLEKSVELGVQIIQPIISERTQIKKESNFDNKISRWQAIMDGASNQCGTAWWPNVRQPIKLSQAINELQTTDAALACLINDSAANQVNKKLSLCERLWIFVGPEGGFTPQESTKLLEKCHSCYLGSLTLRTETAALAALARLLI